MESTRKDKEIHTSKGDIGWGLEYPESQASGGPNTRKGLKKKGPWYIGDPEHTKPNDEVGKARKVEFLTRVFDTLFGHDKYYGFSDKVYLVLDDKGDYHLSEDNPSIDKTHVFYNDHFYIEVIPKEWKYSENGEEFFESQLENIKFIKLETPSSKNTRDETLSTYVNEWTRRGYVLYRFKVPFPPGVCHYCGKKIEGYDPNKRGRGAPKKTCNDHKTSLLSFERYYNKLLGEGKVSETIIDLHDNSPTPRLELERLLRPRCSFCGGYLPDDKPLTKDKNCFCDGVCIKFKTCEDPNKYSPGVMVGGGNNYYCVYQCPNREVVKDRCIQAFKYRLRKERKTNPNLTPEDLTMILKSERALGRQGYTISLAIKLRILKGQPLHGTPETDHYQELLGDEYDKMITRVTQEIQKVKNQK